MFHLGLYWVLMASFPGVLAMTQWRNHRRDPVTASFTRILNVAALFGAAVDSGLLKPLLVVFSDFYLEMPQEIGCFPEFASRSRKVTDFSRKCRRKLESAPIFPGVFKLVSCGTSFLC